MLTRICLFFLTASLAGAVTYSYDSAGRLVKADYGDAGAIVYVYDNAGNLTSRSVQAGGASSSTIASVKTGGAGTDTGQNTGIEIKGVSLTVNGKPAYFPSDGSVSPAPVSLSTAAASFRTSSSAIAASAAARSARRAIRSVPRIMFRRDQHS